MTAMMQEKLQRYRSGNPVMALHIPLSEHVPVELIEDAIDLILERDYNEIEFIGVSARLPDRVGLKIAAIIEKSSTLGVCNIMYNSFSYRVMHAILAALLPNRSLISLSLGANSCCVNNTQTEEALMRVFWINPWLTEKLTISLSDETIWSRESERTRRLKNQVKLWQHPPLLFLLRYYVQPIERTARRRIN